jgi:hypothetical protein
MSHNKKNNRQGFAPPAGSVSRRSCGTLTKFNTDKLSVCSSQVQSVQGDLLNFKVLQCDLFGDECAGGWYD